MILHIIRHGDPDYEHDSLTALGREQAAAIIDLPWTSSVDRILCSPLGRAVETASPLAEYRSISVETKMWLREFDDVTVYSPRRPDLAVWNLEADILRGAEKADWLEADSFKGTVLRERWKEVCGGVDAFLAEYSIYKKEFGWKCGSGAKTDVEIPIFCHLGVGLVILSHLLDISPCTAWRCFFMPPSSVTTLLLEEQGNENASFRVLQMGDTQHLAKNEVALILRGLQYNSK